MAARMAGSRRSDDTRKAISPAHLCTLASSSARLFSQWEGCQPSAPCSYPSSRTDSAIRGILSCGTPHSIPEQERWRLPGAREHWGWKPPHVSRVGWGGGSGSAKEGIATYKRDISTPGLKAKRAGKMAQRVSLCVT